MMCPCASHVTVSTLHLEHQAREQADRQERARSAGEDLARAVALADLGSGSTDSLSRRGRGGGRRGGSTGSASRGGSGRDRRGASGSTGASTTGGGGGRTTRSTTSGSGG